MSMIRKETFRTNSMTASQCRCKVRQCLTSTHPEDGVRVDEVYRDMESARSPGIMTVVCLFSHHLSRLMTIHDDAAAVQ